MSAAEMCRLWLKAVRATSPAKVRQQFRNAAVLGDGSSGFTVELADGTQYETGRSHCRYCARAEALAKLAGAS